MTKVLWFSRHIMTTEQRAALEKKLGEIEIVQIDRTIQSAFELQDEIGEADVVAIVAPINLQAQFLKIAGEKPVITAISRRELRQDPAGGESTPVFIFERWDRIKKIDVVVEEFCS